MIKNVISQLREKMKECVDKMYATVSDDELRKTVEDYVLFSKCVLLLEEQCHILAETPQNQTET